MDGVKLIAFTLDEWKAYGLIVVDYYRLWDYSLSLEWQIKSLNKDVDLWKQRADVWKLSMEDQKARGDMLLVMYNEEHKLRIGNEKKDRATDWIPWTIAIAESVIVAALAIETSVVHQ